MHHATMDPVDPRKFTVGWICALPIELTAARCMLDEEYDNHKLRKHPHDTNFYSLGKIDDHNVALTCLDSAGNNNASLVAHQMKNTFECLDFGLMVGIGGGIPGGIPPKDIRLGDVVVGRGVIQYDAGKFIQDGDFKVTDFVRQPPSVLRKATITLISNHEMRKKQIWHHIQQFFNNHPDMAHAGSKGYRSPGKEHDHLYEAEYTHQGASDTCADCNNDRRVRRSDRADTEPVAHYGIIASGNAVMRDGVRRDKLGRDHDALCVEMEAAGLRDVIPCLTIRGICDYADSHKSKDWQRYAAITAAAYAKELLGVISPSNVEGMSSAPGLFAAVSRLHNEMFDPSLFFTARKHHLPKFSTYFSLS